VIPAFNEEITIEETVQKTIKVLTDLRVDFEILIIDDCSTDSTYSRVEKLSQEYNNIIIYKNEINSGKSFSLNRGFRLSKKPVILIMDADLQQTPDDIPLLLEKIDLGYDVVNGWRVKRVDPKSKLIMSKIFNSFSRSLFKTNIHDMNCGFKAIRKEVLERIILRPGYFRYIAALAKAEGFKVTEVPVRHFKRSHGESKYGFKRVFDSIDLFSIKLKMLFASKPMLLFGTIGGIMLILGIISGGYLGYLKFVLNNPLSEHLPLLFFTTINTLVGISIIITGFLADLIKDLEYKFDKNMKS